MTRRIPTRLPLALVVPLVLGALGCAQDLPEPELIIKPRVLAIKTAVTVPLVEDPADAETPKAEALPFETVNIEPFIVGPEGPIDPDSLDLVWIACELTPGQGLLACIQEAMPISLDEIPMCEAPSFEDLMGEELPEALSPCLVARAFAPDFVVPFSANVFVGGSIELTMIGGPPAGEDGTDTDTCAAELLSGEHDLPDDCLYAVQRLNVGPIELLISIAADFGFEIPGVEVPDPEDIPEPDRHPRISEVRVGQISEGEQIGDALEISEGEVVQATLESTLQVEIDSPEDDLQSYLIPVNNGESYEERDERYSGRWFRTWGQQLASGSDDPMSYNQWTLVQGEQDERETPPGDRARMYYVVRDGRQGVNWFWFEVEALPAPE